MYSGANFPRWTSSELVLAQIGLKTGVSGDLFGNHNASSAPSQLSIEVPALRGVMNCTPHAIKSARRTSDEWLEINITFPEAVALPRGTQMPSWNYANGTLSTLWFSSARAGIVGYWTPDFFGDADWLTTMGLFAKVDADGNPENVTILTCKPYVETIQTNAIFDVPSFDLIAPASPINSTARYFNDDSYFKMSSPDVTQGSNTFDDVLLPVNLTTGYPLSRTDSFFQALFSGIDAVADPLTLVGAANIENLIDAVEHLYRMIMAQCLNTQSYRRVPVGSLPQEAVPQLGQGILSDPNGRRLHQSPTATYLLIGLLLTMFICALVSITTFKAQGLLSKSPNSIASRASLLAGSRLLEIIPPGAEWWSDKELESLLASEGLSLRLGWWADGFGGYRYGIDVLDDQKDFEGRKGASYYGATPKGRRPVSTVDDMSYF